MLSLRCVRAVVVFQSVPSARVRAFSGSPVFPKDHPAIKYPSDWDFPIAHSPVLTTLLQDLAQASVEALPKSDMQAVVLKRSTLFSEGAGYARNVLYIRAHQEPILQKVRSIAYSCLLRGNPGTATSAFQFYYLLRMVNPHFKGQLPPGTRGQIQVPDLVVRQVAEDVQLYDIKNLQAYDMKGMDVRLFSCLNPTKALYFYDPLQSLKEPKLDHDISIFATMAPNPVRHHEFNKRNPSWLFYPMWTLEELLAAHRHMTTTEGVIDPPTGISEQDVVSRYEEFGGIIRHVFVDRKALERKREERRIAIMRQDPKILLQVGLDYPDNPDYPDEGLTGGRITG